MTITKAKVAIIAGQLVVGGAERQLYLWLANLDREKFDVIVLTLHPDHGDYWEEPIKDLGISIFKIPPMKNRLKRLRRILLVLEAFKPDLIHGWHLFASPYAALAAKRLGAKSIGGIRSSLNYKKGIPFELFLSLILIDQMITNSSEAAKRLSRYNFPGKKISIVQNGFEPRQVDREAKRISLAKEFKVDPQQVWICTIGRMIPTKKFDFLVKMCAELFGGRKDFHCFLIGDGPERIYLESLAGDLSVSDLLTFTGEIPNAESFLAAMDIFCFPSVDEGMPNVIIEAAAVGLPVVAWDLPFNNEILSPETAILVPPGDENSFKNRVFELFSSDEKRLRLGTSAKEMVASRFSLSKYIHELTNIYDSLI